MDLLDLSYLMTVSLVGGVARALRRGLPEGWRLRLEARPAESLEPGWIWVHAVSVGELLLAEGIVGRLRDAGYQVHVTTGTVAGMGLLQRRLEAWNQGSGRITGGAFPLDDPAGLRSFLALSPALYLGLETELWPNLLRELEARGVPRVIVNGRLTAKSLNRGGRWLRRAASRLTCVAARDEASVDAFRRLGAPEVVLGGNLKADLPPPPALHSGWDALRKAWAGAPIVIAGNTLEGEETLVIQAWRQARERFPDLRLILAPRQPKRFEAVAQLFHAEGMSFRRASGGWEPRGWEVVDVLLMDTLGELASAYREGTVALIGGGWTWHGGHNPLESVRWGLPTLIGPGFANFEDLVAPLLAEGRLEVLENDGLAHGLVDALENTPLRPSQSEPPPLPNALRGALERTWKELKDFFPESR